MLKLDGLGVSTTLPTRDRVYNSAATPVQTDQGGDYHCRCFRNTVQIPQLGHSSLPIRVHAQTPHFVLDAVEWQAHAAPWLLWFSGPL